MHAKISNTNLKNESFIEQQNDDFFSITFKFPIIGKPANLHLIPIKSHIFLFPVESVLHFENSQNIGNLDTIAHLTPKLGIDLARMFSGLSAKLQYSHAGLEGAEVIDLRPKHKVGQLGIGNEYNKKHDGESQDVLGTARHGGR